MKLGRISSHARVKMRQRGISEAALQRLLASGRVEHDCLGGRIVYFANDEHNQPQDAAALRGIDRCRDSYAVLDCHGEIITVGNRYSRIRGH